jgi:hypothetical protein
MLCATKSMSNTIETNKIINMKIKFIFCVFLNLDSYIV